MNLATFRLDNGRVVREKLGPMVSRAPSPEPAGVLAVQS